MIVKPVSCFEENISDKGTLHLHKRMGTMQKPFINLNKAIFSPFADRSLLEFVEWNVNLKKKKIIIITNNARVTTTISGMK